MEAGGVVVQAAEGLHARFQQRPVATAVQYRLQATRTLSNSFERELPLLAEAEGG